VNSHNRHWHVHARFIWKLFTLTILSPLPLGHSLEEIPQPLTTAFEARAMAQSVVSEESRDKVVQIRGIREDGQIHPRSWMVVFWNPELDDIHAVLVSDGKALDLKDQMNLVPGGIDSVNFSESDIIDPLYFQVDSDHALEILLGVYELREKELSSIDFVLEKDLGPVWPVWNLTIYRTRVGGDQAFGFVQISADSGEVFDVRLADDFLHHHPLNRQIL
jgi:hypothetical protein